MTTLATLLAGIRRKSSFQGPQVVGRKVAVDIECCYTARGRTDERLPARISPVGDRRCRLAHLPTGTLT